MSGAALFNTALAFVVSLAAVWSVSRMNGTTPHVIRAGIVLILVGCMGQVAGVLMREWDHWVDTIFYFGVLVLLLGNRRYKKLQPAAEKG